jgi:hypothetical protein
MKEERQKVHKLHGPIYMNYPKQAIHTDSRLTSGCQGVERMGKETDCLMGRWFLLG